MAPDPYPDRHKPEDAPVNFRADADMKAWLGTEAQRRGISRSALIYEALREKREREEALHAAAS